MTVEDSSGWQPHHPSGLGGKIVTVAGSGAVRVMHVERFWSKLAGNQPLGIVKKLVRTGGTMRSGWDHGDSYGERAIERARYVITISQLVNLTHIAKFLP